MNRYLSPRRAVSMASGEVSEDLYFASGEASGVSGEVSESVRDSVRESVRGRSQTWKATRNAGFFTPVRAIMNAIPITLFIVSAVLTIREEAVIFQAVGYLATIGAFILLDPLRLITRVLAPQTRVIITIDISLIITVLFYSVTRFVIIALAWIIGTGLISRFLNAEWLSAYNWFMSENVRRSLIQDPDATGVKAWNDHGLREVRTILSEIGLEFDNMTLEAYGKPLYICGFYSGYRKTTKAENIAEKAQEENEKLKRRVRALEIENADLREELTATETNGSEKIAELTEYKNRYDYMNKRYNEIKKENDLLRATNEELIADIPEPDQIAETIESAEEETDAKIRRLLSAKDKNGASVYSIRTIAELTGVKKNRVEKVKKSMIDGSIDPDPEDRHNGMRIVSFKVG